MNNVTAIKAYAANLAALVYVNNHHDVETETAKGATILYRVSTNDMGDFIVEGFRASMADGDHKSFKAEMENGVLWAGAKNKVFEYLNAKDRASTELMPLEMPFMDSKFEEFFIAEMKPVVSFFVSAACIHSEAVAA